MDVLSYLESFKLRERGGRQRQRFQGAFLIHVPNILYTEIPIKICAPGSYLSMAWEWDSLFCTHNNVMWYAMLSY